MARNRDDDDRDDRDDDRPRRRHDDDRPRRSRRGDDDPPKKSGGTGTVLLIVGLAVGLPLLICGGLGVWGFFWVKGKAEEVAGLVQSHAAADNFLDALERNSIDSAYTSYTTTNYRNTTSKESFTALVKANPALLTTNSHYQTGSPAPTGTAPNRKLVLVYSVSSYGSGIDDPDPFETPPTNKKPGGVKPPPVGDTGKMKDLTCTVTVVEQPGGGWLVDGFTVP